MPHASSPSMSHRRFASRGRLGLVGFVLASLLAAIPVGAGADDFGVGPPNAGYRADSYIHTYCFDTGFDETTAARYAMGTSLDLDTDISDSEYSYCPSTVDVLWQEVNLAEGVRGSYSCRALNGNICDSAYVRLDVAEINEGSNDSWDTIKTACHEAGHSVGLIHGDLTDCMRNDEIPNTDVQYRRYNSHHKSHINGAY